MARVLLFNPFSTKNGFRIPNSILQIAASIEGKHEYVLVDGNLVKDPWKSIEEYLATNNISFFGCTVMPGPQLEQAIPFSRIIKEHFPGIIIIWGGYFASNQYRTVLDSGYVDFVINGPGDYAFPGLLDCLEQGDKERLKSIENLIFMNNGEIVKTAKVAIHDQDKLKQLPYDTLNKFYPIKKYLMRSFLGKQTIAYHSSMGCPFTCSFCAVVPIFNARWKGKSANNVFNDILYIKNHYGGDAIEFHDNNFFVSEQRTVEFSKLIQPVNMTWWGEGRIDTINKYQDKSLEIMRESGCKMIFFGAETGNDEVLAQMNKGGTQNADQIRTFAARMKQFDIIPEYSFVLGMPGKNEQQVSRQIDMDIAFIKEIKEINPATEIIIYIFSPVPTEGSELYETVKNTGFEFPNKLEEWLDPAWAKFDLRRNPLTPWLKPYMIDKIQGFETVLNARYPTVSDFKLSSFQRKMISRISSLRYNLSLYRYPYELKALQKFWLRYRRPEIEGFLLE